MMEKREYDKLINEIEDAKGMLADVDHAIYGRENVLNPIADAIIACDEAVAHVKELRDKSD